MDDDRGFRDLVWGIWDADCFCSLCSRTKCEIVLSAVSTGIMRMNTRCSDSSVSSFPTNRIHLAQHDHLQAKQAHHLREPLQGCVPHLPSSHYIQLTAFSEGVLVAKKDYNAPKHEELDIPNLEVIKAMQSLTSKGLVKTQFSWQWYYYILTPEGVEFLREWYVPSPDPPISLHVHRPLCMYVQAPPPSGDRPRDTQARRPSSPPRGCAHWRRRRRVPRAPWRP